MHESRSEGIIRLVINLLRSVGREDSQPTKVPMMPSPHYSGASEVGASENADQKGGVAAGKSLHGRNRFTPFPQIVRPQRDNRHVDRFQ